MEIDLENLKALAEKYRGGFASIEVTLHDEAINLDGVNHKGKKFPLASITQSPLKAWVKSHYLTPGGIMDSILKEIAFPPEKIIKI